MPYVTASFMRQEAYPNAKESNLTRETVWSLAESVARQIEFRPSSSVFGAAKKLGGRIKVEDTLASDPEKSGSLYVDGKGDFTIVLPLHTGSARDRFTIAHELGHYVVHYLWPRQQDPELPVKMKALRRGSKRVEWEANWFAAAFLMPKTQFKKSFHAYNGNLDKLALKFRVSRSAAEVRAKSLGLI